MKKYKTFRDLKFKKHSAHTEGLQAVELFPNGYGVSVVRFKLAPIPGFPDLSKSFGREYASYCRDETEWEVAILKGSKKNWSLCYSTPITDDVLGYQKVRDVTRVMKRVQAL